MADNQKKEVIKFKLANNLMVIPIEVNGVELSFILDTGVNKPILFNLFDSDTLQVKQVEEIYLKGLGEGEAIKAYRSKGNKFRMDGIYNPNQELYIVLDKEINFSPKLGIPVHGIIGYDLIKDFVLDINYVSKKIKFYRKGEYEYKECKKCEEFDLELFRNKPYLKSKVTIENSEEIDVKLLIDTGSSDALWLFKDEEKGIKIPTRKFEDFLGRGLSGSIFGERSRVDNFRVGSFGLKDAKVSFPDSLSIQFVRNMNNRNGSVGAEILKRFHMVLDYSSNKVTLRKNSNFKDPFKYNMSGIEVQHNGIRLVRELASNINGVVARNESDATGTVKVVLTEQFKFSLHPSFEIAELRENSPAALAGLKIGDVLLSINGKQTHRYSLQEVNELLNERVGKKIRLTIDRKGVELRFFFELKRVL
ncbi:PDZ domain-containing protein [Leptobacterium flavescens]|uniref:PDZ domain-containing protein n=1 Tax=Leptobacterium flavescens TaxID=472055 RepID=A0A6P0UKF5_9FLAO|nr:aspartyl protease family protein [Leptobacterium flavescens]NER12368.1 PDZ domain-containing protein [Leptobacterium flavescens]